MRAAINPSTLRIGGRMSEEELSDHVRKLSRGMRLLHYHTYDSRKSQPGYPDWHIVGASGSLFRELKSESGRLTADQQQWLDALQALGMNAGVWRPRDLLTGRIRRELVTISALVTRRDA